MDINNMMLYSVVNLLDNTYQYKYNSQTIQFDRIGYNIELFSFVYGHQFLNLSCDPFTANIEHMCIPCTHEHIFQQNIENVNIFSNTFTGVVKTCRIEFTPYNYTPSNNCLSKSNITSGESGTYGCMQFLTDCENNCQCMFAYNNFNSEQKDIGIGKNAFGFEDWTHAQNSTIYSLAVMKIYILPTLSYSLLNNSEQSLLFSAYIPYIDKISFSFDYNKFRSKRKPFKEVVYFLLIKDIVGNESWINLRMKAFTSNIEDLKIQYQKLLQKRIENIQVHSNTIGVCNYPYGTFVSSPFDYIVNENNSKTFHETGNYGCFQFETEGNTLLAINNINNSMYDIGIGNNLLGHRDWTLSHNTFSFISKKLEIYYIPTRACEYVDEVSDMRLYESFNFFNKRDECYISNIDEISNSTYDVIAYFFMLEHESNGSEWFYVSFKIDQTLRDFHKKSDYTINVLDVSIKSNVPILNVKNATIIKTSDSFEIIGVFKIDSNEVYFYQKNDVNTYKSITVDVYVNNIEHKPDFILLLTGQSNSQGYGGWYETTSLQDAIDENILSWNCYRNVWEVANLENTIGTKPANYQSFGFHFAKEWIKYNYDKKIGIVMYGFGSQSISRWIEPNSSLISSSFQFKQDTGDIFEQTVNQLSLALKAADKKCIDTILWHQGEADCFESEEYYRSRLTHLIQQYRKQSFASENLPFIVGELAISNKILSKQNNVLRSLNTNNDQFTRCSKTSQLRTSDGIHFTSQSHREMGKLYYYEYINTMRINVSEQYTNLNRLRSIFKTMFSKK